MASYVVREPVPSAGWLTLASVALDDVVERDRGRAEVVQSSAFGHIVSTQGLLALLLFPLAWVLTRLARRFRRR